MTRRIWINAALGGAVALSACEKLKHRVNPAATIEEPGELRTRIDMFEPSSEAQILRGFHPLEGGGWRWTKKSFAVTLRPPRGGALQGAKLEMKVTLPEAVAPRLPDLTITAKVNGSKLPPYLVPGAGEHIYSAQVPREALQGETAIVEFELNKSIPAGVVDTRELGVIVTAIWFAEP